MAFSLRVVFCGSALAVITSQTACSMVPKSQLAQCQTINRDLHVRNKSILSELENERLHAQDLAQQTAQVQQDLAVVEDLNASLEDRVAQFAGERSDLERQYSSLMNQVQNQSPLPRQVQDQLSQFAARYPDAFEFDPATGVSKFHADVLFPLGQDALRPQSQKLLAEFAEIFQTGDASDLNILVVGHTDDRPIARTSTRAKHPSNWHLSVHRAVAVEQFLNKSGISEGRMGVAGYGEFQPIVANRTAADRQKNRRVEIFVLAPNSEIAGRAQDRSIY